MFMSDERIKDACRTHLRICNELENQKEYPHIGLDQIALVAATIMIANQVHDVEDAVVGLYD